MLRGEGRCVNEERERRLPEGRSATDLRLPGHSREWPCHSHFFAGVMLETGTSQWARRISKRRCSSRSYAAWSGKSFFLVSSSAGLAVVAMVEFLKVMVTR